MKLGIKKKKQAAKSGGLYEDTAADQGEEGGSASAGWMTTDHAEMAAAAEAAKLQSSRNRPPELYIRDGESVLLRFRTSKPIASFRQYSAMMQGKWRPFTAPAPGSVDRYAEAGLRSKQVYVYEVVDINGFTDRTGKKHTFIPRFFVVGTRLYEQLQALQEEVGMPLSKYDIKIKRSGQKTNTTYMLFAQQPSPAHPKVLEAERLKDKVEQYYAPLSAKQQAAVLSQVTSPDDE